MGHKSLWSAEFNPSYSVQGWGTFLGLFQICKDPKKYLKTPIKATENLKRLSKTNVFVSKGESTVCYCWSFLKIYNCKIVKDQINN